MAKEGSPLLLSGLREQTTIPICQEGNALNDVWLHLVVSAVTKL